MGCNDMKLGLCLAASLSVSKGADDKGAGEGRLEWGRIIRLNKINAQGCHS